MNRDQEKIIASEMRFYWEKIFTYIKQGDKESAKKLIEDHIKKINGSLKKFMVIC